MNQTFPVVVLRRLKCLKDSVEGVTLLNDSQLDLVRLSHLSHSFAVRNGLLSNIMYCAPVTRFVRVRQVADAETRNVWGEQCLSSNNLEGLIESIHNSHYTCT
jgi:hypothetical protein